MGTGRSEVEGHVWRRVEDGVMIWFVASMNVGWMRLQMATGNVNHMFHLFSYVSTPRPHGLTGRRSHWTKYLRVVEYEGFLHLIISLGRYPP